MIPYSYHHRDDGWIHQYLSTACLHADRDGVQSLHEDCQTGGKRWDGSVKKPASCKFCHAPCICDCHRLKEAA